MIVIMAHAGAQATFDRHMRYWESHGSDILVFCPKNAPVKTRHQTFLWGRASHHDAMANERFFRCLEFANRLDYERFVFHEYDSLCFASVMPDLPPEFLWANVWANNGESNFQASVYLHPPLIMSKPVLESVVAGFSTVKFSDEAGYWDRLLGLVIERAGIRYGALQPDRVILERAEQTPCRNNTSFMGLGFSRTRIEPNEIPAATEARMGGAVFFHGIKFAPVLEALTNP